MPTWSGALVETNFDFDKTRRALNNSITKPCNYEFDNDMKQEFRDLIHKASASYGVSNYCPFTGDPLSAEGLTKDLHHHHLGFMVLLDL